MITINDYDDNSIRESLLIEIQIPGVLRSVLVYAPITDVAEIAERLSIEMPHSVVLIIQNNTHRVRFIDGEVRNVFRLEDYDDDPRNPKTIDIPYKGELL